MLPTGPLLTSSFLLTDLRTVLAGRLGESTREAAYRRFRAWWMADGRWLGPASSLRTLFDRGVARLAGILGYRGPTGVPATADGPFTAGQLDVGAAQAAGLLITAWGEDLSRTWRVAVRHGIRLEAAWCLAFNGCALCLIDVRRTYARRFLEFDLGAAARDPHSFELLWGLARAEALVADRAAPGDRPSVLEQAIAASEQHQAAICTSLQGGVEQALVRLVEGFIQARRPTRAGRHLQVAAPAVLEQALTLVYRLLFLLFAEARGALPVWHPVYRSSYSLETLTDRLAGPRSPRGLWEALQAISRLAYHGCRAGDLEATGFNGRLFSPARAPLLDRLAVGDEVARDALVALTTRDLRPAGRQRIAYADLGVEQLGAVYERVLDFEPHLAGTAGRVRVELRPTSGRRKATGTFYTPRSLTEYLVRRTLAPLVERASADDILRLRIVDPAMGSGAFLVAACRYLARAYEAARLRDEALRPADLDERDRAGFRRLIAQRCLFGVDRNPMAVQLARLSLWLTTLAADQPLTFLDHTLRVGDSLVGASLDDVARQPPGREPGQRPPAALPLFEDDTLEPAIRASVVPRARIALAPDDTVAAVRDKERTLAALEAADAPLSRWKALCDLWCALWFWNGDEPPPRLFGSLSDVLFGREGQMPAHVARAWLAQAREAASARQFFHWTLEFPEVFFDPDGRPRPCPGFDAVIGNPPWEMVRADEGSAAERDERRHAARALLHFARASGIYRASGDAHLNLYQLFVERALTLVRERGRIGLVLPAGLASDAGAADLRRLLFERCDTDTLVGLENRHAIFPVHRSVRFLLVTSTRGGRTAELACRFGVDRPEALDAIADGRDRSALPLALTPAFLRRVSGDALAVPYLRSPRDFAILDRTSRSAPWLGDAHGWGARFGRELNATDDRALLVGRGEGLPVAGGRQIEPFRVHADACEQAIPERTAASRLDRDTSFGRPRLAYRDVSSATNRLTLIAAVVPAGVVTLHTLFCLKGSWPIEAQHVLCGILNSYVANYLVRQRVTSHVTVSIVEQLPVPAPSGGAIFDEIGARARELAGPTADRLAPLARLNALVARLYDLSAEEFDHVLSTFPLIEDEEKARAREVFADLSA